MLMKKILLTIYMVIMTVSAIAQTKSYTDVLQVIINNESETPQETTILVEEKADGTYTLSLNNFMLQSIAVGNIVLTGISTTDEGAVKSFSTKQTIVITNGDDASQFWIGPMIGEVPVDLKGKMTDDKLYCVIDIDLSSIMGQVIKVIFGNDISTSIDVVKDNDESAVIYDLTGRRVDTITNSGIYIVNSKKVLVK